MTLYHQVRALLLVKGKPANHDSRGSSSCSSGKNAILLDGRSRNGVPVGWRLQEKVWRGKSWRRGFLILCTKLVPSWAPCWAPLGADPWPHSKDLDSWTEMETSAHRRWHGACGLTQLDSLLALKKKNFFPENFNKTQSLHNAMQKMSRRQSKIMRHRGTTKFSRERQSLDAPKMTQRLEFSDKDFKHLS